MSRTSCFVFFSVVIAMMISFWAFNEPVAKANWCAACYVVLRPENDQRRVIGTDLDLECPDENFSTPYWGNWGVESGLSQTWDGDQFRGWKDIGGHHEWNSCTNDEGPSRPNTFYYNDNDGNSQKSDGWNYYANSSYTVPYECALTYDGTVYTTYNNHMDLYELDDFVYSSDDYADTIWYGNLDVLINCSGDDCYGESGETGLVTGNLGRAQAKINYKIYTSPTSIECE